MKRAIVWMLATGLLAGVGACSPPTEPRFPQEDEEEQDDNTDRPGEDALLIEGLEGGSALV